LPIRPDLRADRRMPDYLSGYALGRLSGHERGHVRGHVSARVQAHVCRHHLRVAMAAEARVAGSLQVVVRYDRNYYSPVEWAAHRPPGGQGLPTRLKTRRDQRRPVPQDQRRAE
jgi:hypothetical protein